MPVPTRRRRGVVLAALTLLVLALHAWVGDRLAGLLETAGWDPAPERLDAAFVRELRAQAPSAVTASVIGPAAAASAAPGGGRTVGRLVWAPAPAAPRPVPPAAREAPAPQTPPAAAPQGDPSAEAGAPTAPSRRAVDLAAAADAASDAASEPLPPASRVPRDSIEAGKTAGETAGDAAHAAEPAAEAVSSDAPERLAAASSPDAAGPAAPSREPPALALSGGTLAGGGSAWAGSDEAGRAAERAASDAAGQGASAQATSMMPSPRPSVAETTQAEAVEAAASERVPSHDAAVRASPAASPSVAGADDAAALPPGAGGGASSARGTGKIGGSTAESAASSPGDPGEAGAGQPFTWPLSTQLSYQLGGHFRGEVHGSAEVRWLRQGERYQVHLDVRIGPSFAPMAQRRMTSDGVITPAGLAPRRYDEETQYGFGRAHRASVRFERDATVLTTGRRVPAWAGVQDAASQLVQLAFLFSTQPGLLQAGGRVELPLALPRRADLWAYDVVGEETLATPLGELPTWHLRPRRAADATTLSIETWFAPTLQHLPVRIIVRQSAETWLDLRLDRWPQQAADGASAIAR
jgi:hypothetical protein